MPTSLIITGDPSAKQDQYSVANEEKSFFEGYEKHWPLRGGSCFGEPRH